MCAKSLLVVCVAFVLVACDAPRREEARYVEGLAGRNGMVFGQAFFDVESVENFTIGDDPKMVHFAVLPMQFAVRECGGVTVHADATLDTSLHEEAFQDLHKVRDGVFRKQDVGSYLVVAPGHSGGMFEGGFHFTEVRIESGDLPCATAWLEDRLHRVRVRSESEIRNRLP